MTEQRFYLDIHAIQTLPPSNVNRDDTGSPKTAMYGGVIRARVSSQAWKRAMRQYFLKESAEELGIRSKYVVNYLAKTIIAKDPSITEDNAINKAALIFETVTGLKTKEGNKIDVLFFLGKKQAKMLVNAIGDVKDEKALKKILKDKKEELKKILKDNPEIDIALFGRMVAGVSSLNEDASAQVAHAISTHEVQTEFDYYTALDDYPVDDNAGAAMIDTIEYNSSTLYRYANIALHDLSRQLGSKEQAIATAKLFIQAFANSMPTGKSNTFANQTLPQLLMINIRTDRPVNLVTAYENPVKPMEGYVMPSIKCLFDEVKKTEKFVQAPEKTLYVVEENIEKPEWATEENSISALIDDFAKIAEKLL